MKNSPFDSWWNKKTQIFINLLTFQQAWDVHKSNAEGTPTLTIYLGIK
jgi:hypothetical protein